MIPDPRIAEIQEAVCAHYGLSRGDMSSPRRSRSLAYPRQLAMFLARAVTHRSLPEIGLQFHRDHSTVIHAVRAVEKRLSEDYDLACDTVRIMQRVASHVANRAEHFITGEPE